MGCGPGSLSGVITARGGHAVGIDISATMVDEARELVPGARFEVADAQVDDLGTFAPPGGLDAIASRFGVMFFDEPVTAFGNIRQAVKPGGRLAFVCWRSEAENPTFTLGNTVLLARLPSPPPAPPVGDPGPMSFADPRQHLARHRDPGELTGGNPYPAERASPVPPWRGSCHVGRNER